MIICIASVYPELFALVGARVPDFRGLFLRGQGGESSPLGVLQQDAGRNVTGSVIHNTPDSRNQGIGEGSSTGTGAFSIDHETRYMTEDNTGGTSSYIGAIHLDASRIWGVVHTAEEFRPINRAVRYLIRALP